MDLKRGEIYWVDFDPSVGGEIKKARPAVIISNDAANSALNRVLVVPLSSQITRVYPGEILVQVRGQLSKAMADQLTTASKLRFQRRVGGALRTRYGTHRKDSSSPARDKRSR